MGYSLRTVLHEASRFIPAAVTIASGTMLFFLQAGLVAGMLELVVIPITHAQAEIWLCAKGTTTIHQASSVPERWIVDAEAHPGIKRVDRYLFGPSMLKRRDGTNERCIVVGFNPTKDSLGAIDLLTAEQLQRLKQNGAFVINRDDSEVLGIKPLDLDGQSVGEVGEQRAYCVGMVEGLDKFEVPYLLCSTETAFSFLPNVDLNQSSYVLASCHDPLEAPRIAAELQARNSDKQILTASQFANKSQLYWLTSTRAGLVLGCLIVLAVSVTLVVTNQTLFAATAAASKEFAVLEALGIPRWRVILFVLFQSFWVAVGALLLAFPFTFLGGRFLANHGFRFSWNSSLLLAGGILTIITVLVSGVMALRSLKLAEPARLLR